MPTWLTAIIGGLGSFVGAIGQWMQDVHTTNVQKQAMKAQQTTDALQGESHALEQVDDISTAVDAGGVHIADDPANRNR